MITNTERETLERLEAKLAEALTRATELQGERRRLSYEAGIGNTSARKQLDAANAGSATASLEIENCKSAIDECRRRLEVAEKATIAAENIEKAKRALGIAAGIEGRGKRLDAALLALAVEAENLENDLSELNYSLGFVSPSLANFRAIAERPLNAGLMFQPSGKTRSDGQPLQGTLKLRHLPPGERMTFSEITEGYAKTIRRTCGSCAWRQVGGGGGVKRVIWKRADGDGLEHLPELLESIASIVGDEDLSQDEREAMLAQTFDLYREFTGGRDGLADIAATRGSKAEKGIEQMTKVDIGALAQVALEGAAVALRKREPHLTAEQAFSRVYQDPAYSVAAKAEREDSRRRIAGVSVTQTQPEILNDVLSDVEIKRLITRERAKFPFLNGEQLLAVVEASPEMKAHRAAVRAAQAAARRDGSTLKNIEIAKRDDAFDALKNAAAELHKANPALSFETCFAKVYSANRPLAKAERGAAMAAIFAG
jgi:hypothetical protein